MLDIQKWSGEMFLIEMMEAIILKRKRSLRNTTPNRNNCMDNSNFYLNSFEYFDAPLAI